MSLTLEQALKLKPGDAVFSNTSTTYPYSIQTGKKYVVLDIFPVYRDDEEVNGYHWQKQELFSKPCQIMLTIQDDTNKTVDASHLNFERNERHKKRGFLKWLW